MGVKLQEWDSREAKYWITDIEDHKGEEKGGIKWGKHKRERGWVPRNGVKCNRGENKGREKGGIKWGRHKRERKWVLGNGVRWNRGEKMGDEMGEK